MLARHRLFAFHFNFDQLLLLAFEALPEGRLLGALFAGSALLGGELLGVTSFVGACLEGAGADRGVCLAGGTYVGDTCLVGGSTAGGLTTVGRVILGFPVSLTLAG